MASSTRRWTVAEREKIPYDGKRYEIIGGEMFVSPVPRPRHEAIVMELASALRTYAGANRIGTVSVRSEIVLTDHDVLEPDIAVYPFDRETLPERWSDAPTPLLVVEVRSESTWRRDVGVKRALYLSGGVPEYWIVDDQACAVTIVRAGEAEIVVRDALRWRPAGAHEPFEISLADVF